MARKPKYRRHSTRDLGFAEHGGKRTYFRGPYGSEESLNGYRDFLKDAGFLVKGGTHEGAVTLAVLADRFLNWAQLEYPSGPRSYYANLEDSLTLLAKASAVELAVNFTPLRMKEFQQWLVGRGLSRKYINGICGNVRLMFKWGVSEELIPVATWQALLTVPGLRKGRTAAKELPPRKPVKWEHVAATLPRLSATVRAMVLTQWHTGLRGDSVCTARVRQFDRSTATWQWHPKHKTEYLDKSLTIFVGPQAQRVLRPYLDGKPPDAYVFQPLNKKGSRSRRYRSFYDSTTYRQAVTRAAKKAGVPHWSPHQLRHARATLVREKFGLEAAQAALGHARIDATQIYAQKQLALAKMVAEQMG